MEDAGFAVLEASNADEALAILESRSDIRAVFTDIRMPGSMDGWELAGAIRRRWPPMHLIVASAHAPNGGDFARKRAVYRQAIRGRTDNSGAL